VQNLLGVAVLAGFGYYIYWHRSAFRQVLETPAEQLLLLGCLIPVTLVLNATQSWLLVRGVGVDLGFFEGVLLSLATSFGNYLPMRAGTVVRAHYLKSVHRLPYARFGSVFGIRTLITAFATGLLGIVAVLLIWTSSGRLSTGLLVAFLALVVMPGLAWFIPLPQRRHRQNRLLKMVDELFAGAHQLRRQPGLGSLVLVGVILQELSLVARFYLSVKALGGEAEVPLLLLMAPVAALASYAALTPGALGLREGAMGAATYAVGATFSSGAIMGTLDRTVLLGVITLAGGFSFLHIWRRIRRAESGRQLDEAP
jgi:uncharacterized membrane protein YbhN (UPF0104 family)